MKRQYTFKLGAVNATSNGVVHINGWIDSGPDNDRPLKLEADAAWVLAYAERLAEAARRTLEHTEAATPEQVTCVRCGRKYRPDERGQLVDAGEGKLKCDPTGPRYDACMRIYNTV